MTNSPFIPYSGHNKLSSLLTGLLDFTVPEGYQDEAGFHLIPVRTGVSRPPVEAPVWLGEYI